MRLLSAQVPCLPGSLRRVCAQQPSWGWASGSWSEQLPEVLSQVESLWLWLKQSFEFGGEGHFRAFTALSRLRPEQWDVLPVVKLGGDII